MKEKGVALIMTLWVLVFLTVVAMNFSFSSRLGSASTRNFKEDTQAHYLAVSAYEETLAYLLTDKDPQVDFIDKDGNFRTDAERAPITGKRKVGDFEVEIKITDEESRLNINRLNDFTLKKLFTYVGVPEDSIQELIDSLADWKDPDDLHHLSGAEDEYYEPLGYKTKNSPLETPEELLLIKGFTPEYLYGGKDTIPLYPMITTWGRSININTASKEILEVLGFSAEEIDALMRQKIDEDGLRSIPRKLAGVGTTASYIFRIEVTARLKDNPQAVKITSIVRRNFGVDGPETKTLFWKEDIESSRA